MPHTYDIYEPKPPRLGTDACTDTESRTEESSSPPPVSIPPITTRTTARPDPGCSFPDFISFLFCVPTPVEVYDEEIIIYPPPSMGTERAAATASTVTTCSSSNSPLSSTDPNSSVSLPSVEAVDADNAGLSPERLSMIRLDILERAKVYMGLDESGQYKHISLQWALQSSRQGVTVHSCSFPGDTAIVVRSKYRLLCSIEDVKRVLLDEQSMFTLDATLDKFEVMSCDALNYLRVCVQFVCCCFVSEYQ